MKHVFSIENKAFSATIDLHGAQLSSLKHKERDEEYIWQRDPAFWGESAPVLFPIVGGLKDGQYQYHGRTYKMNKHGVVRYADFQIVRQDGNSCEVMVKATEETLRSFPFHFALKIGFRLTMNGIVIDYQITNEDDKDMPASLGYHPAFNIDIQHFDHDDYEIAFSKSETLDLYYLKEGVLALKQREYLQQEQSIRLSKHIFDEDALVFKNIASDCISLRRKNSSWRLDMYTGGAPHLGIWAKPAAPYVCIEPWYTYQDSAAVSGDIFAKPGMFVLKPGETFNSFYEVQVFA